MQFDHEYFSKALRAAMQGRGWKQKQFGEFFGIDRSNISAWINNERLPDEKHMAKFAELTDLTEEELKLLRMAIKLEGRGINLVRLSGKGIVLSDDERLLIQWVRSGNFASAIEHLAQRMKSRKAA